MENAIVLIGNTGVGKSFICNKIFEVTGSKQEFNSSSSIGSVTGDLQQGKITYKGNSYTLVDTPGFFDCSSESVTAADSARKDGENVCKLVRALENSKSICAIVFVFVGRLDVAQRQWYDRILSIIGTAYQGQIILLHNKENQTDVERIRNETRLSVILGKDNGEAVIQYQPLTMFISRGGAEEKEILDNQIREFLNGISQRVPFTLTNLQVPEVCYEKEVLGEPYDKELSRTMEDVGQTVVNKKDGSYYQDVEVWHPDPIKKALGYKVILKKFVERMVEESVHVKKEVATQIVGTFQNVYKIRFDDTKDLAEIRLIKETERKFGLTN